MATDADDGIYRIMVYLDTLFDTRLGTMAKINDDHALMALCNLYSERVTDDTQTYCPPLDFEVFKHAYEKRDITTLMAAVPTLFAVTLGAILRSIETKFICGSPHYFKYELLINTAPYKLTAIERDSIRNSIVSYTKMRRDIRFVDVPVEKLELTTIRNMQLKTIHLYEFDTWYSNAFNGKELVETGASIIVPALHVDCKALDMLKELQRDMGSDPDPFFDMAAMHCEWIAMEFTDSATYSISPHLLIPIRD